MKKLISDDCLFKSSLDTNTSICSSLCFPPSLRIRAQIINRISAQWASILVATLEPLVQTSTMEEVLAGAASLVRHCLVTANDAIANGALGLALESTANVALKGR
jgi:hypothetical protein